MRCRCCGEIGDFTIPARDGTGCVCKRCYDFINAPLKCSMVELKRLSRFVIARSLRDLLTLRRYKSTSKKFCSRWAREIKKNGEIAEGFLGDVTGRFSDFCSIADLIPGEGKERLNCLTAEEINDILEELGK